MKSKHENHPLYTRAKRLWEKVRLQQIRKGAEKYPEPLNPQSWTVAELVEHGIQENVDQLHYFVALLDKVEGMEAELVSLKEQLANEKNRRIKAENDARRAFYTRGL